MNLFHFNQNSFIDFKKINHIKCVIIQKTFRICKSIKEIHILYIYP